MIYTSLLFLNTHSLLFFAFLIWFLYRRIASIVEFSKIRRRREERMSLLSSDRCQVMHETLEVNIIARKRIIIRPKGGLTDFKLAFCRGNFSIFCDERL